MLNQETDETLMRSEWRAMNTDRRLFGVVAIFVNEIETARLREVDLVGRDGKLATDGAPRLHVDLRPVKRSFVWHFDKIDSRILEHVSRHYFGLFPKLRFIDEFLSKLAWIVSGKAHQILLDAEELEVFQIHLVHGIELSFELVLRAIDVRVVHLHRAHSHQPD